MAFMFLLVFGRQVPGVRLDPPACLGVVSAGGMEYDGVLLGCLESLALDGMDMQQLGAFHVLDLAQGGYQFHHIVSVARTEVADVHAVEDVLLVGQERFQGVVEADDLLPAALVQDAPLEQVLGGSEPEVVIEFAGMQLVQVMFHAAHAVVDAHIVVIQDDEQVVVRT